MKKNILIANIILSVSILFLTSCAFGFEPAWKSKDGKATISLQFNTIESISRADTADRAIIQGDGFLYIRTIGGPKGSSGPLYGPFAMKLGEKFESNAIPAGSYTNIGFLYCAANMDAVKLTYNGVEYTFRQFMSLPDNEFLPATEGGDGKESPFSEVLDGSASGKLLGPVTIKEGKTTTFTMTMEPITGSKSYVYLGKNNAIDIISDGTTLVRKFIQIGGILDGIPKEATVSDIVCVLYPDASAVIGKVTLYDKSGVAVPNFAEKTGPAGARLFKAPYTGGDSLYLYIEFIATSLTIECNRELAGGSTFKVLFSGGAGLETKRLFAGLYTSPDPGGMMIGSGILTVGADGSGEITLLSGGTTQPVFVLKDTTYYLWVFIDVNGNYTDVVNMTTPGVMAGIVPHYADLVPLDKFIPIPITGSGASISFTPSLFHAVDKHVYFVASAPAGTGSGQTLANACDISYAISNANTTGGKSVITLISPVTVNAPLAAFGAEMSFQSFNSTPQTVSLNTTSGLSISTNVNVSFNNIIVDGMIVSRTLGLFNISMGRLILLNGSVIKRATTPTEGAAVRVSGTGTLEIAGGFITGCNATTYGGGVSIQSGGTVLMSAGSINNCAASSYGGAVYMAAGGTMTMSGGELSTNSAPSGGGVRMDGGTFTLSGGTILNNDANNGGGVYIGAGSFTMSGGMIGSTNPANGNTAGSSGNGGGIYLLNAGALYLLPSILANAITGNSATGSGGGLYSASTNTQYYNGTPVLSADTTSIAYIFTGNTAASYADMYIP